MKRDEGGRIGESFPGCRRERALATMKYYERSTSLSTVLLPRPSQAGWQVSRLSSKRPLLCGWTYWSRAATQPGRYTPFTVPTNQLALAGRLGHMICSAGLRHVRQAVYVCVCESERESVCVRLVVYSCVLICVCCVSSSDHKSGADGHSGIFRSDVHSVSGKVCLHRHAASLPLNPTSLPGSSSDW